MEKQIKNVVFNVDTKDIRHWDITKDGIVSDFTVYRNDKNQLCVESHGENMNDIKNGIKVALGIDILDEINTFEDLARVGKSCFK